MRIDSKLSGLLSNFFLDISKAYFIAAFVTPTFSSGESFEVIITITKALIGTVSFLFISWNFAKIERK